VLLEAVVTGNPTVPQDRQSYVNIGKLHHVADKHLLPMAAGTATLTPESLELVKNKMLKLTRSGDIAGARQSESKEPKKPKKPKKPMKSKEPKKPMKPMKPKEPMKVSVSAVPPPAQPSPKRPAGEGSSPAGEIRGALLLLDAVVRAQRIFFLD
jgi:hypothetical protein